MTKISDKKAKIGKGQRVKLGSNDAYEVYQNPATGQLEIIDTENNSRALVDKEDRGQIGGSGAFIKALKNGEPMADTGKTYSTVQGAVDAASSWVFVPPRTYNESVTVETEGLTLRGAGYNTLITDSSGSAIKISANSIAIENISVETTGGTNNAINDSEGISNISLDKVAVRDTTSKGIELSGSTESTITSCIVKTTSENGAIHGGDKCIIRNCVVEETAGSSFPAGIIVREDSVASSNIVSNTDYQGVVVNGPDGIAVGNRIISSGNDGIRVNGDDCIVANNRISDSGSSDIDDRGSNTTLDGNLTGSAN
jgi:hypothetical protein